MSSEGSVDLPFAKPAAAGDIYALAIIDDPSDSYLAAAVLSLLRLIDAGDEPKVCRVLRRREDIASTCVLAFLSLEACINRLFFDIFEAEPPSRPLLPSVPRAVVSYIQRTWLRMSVREKWLVLPPLVSTYSFDVATTPFTLFDEFIRFRNRLVHPKALLSRMKIRATRVEEGSWGGDVLEHMSDIQPSEQLFPLTRFSTTFNGLELDDAEKCVEISYRMRMALAIELPWIPPGLIYEQGSEVITKFGTSIGELLKDRVTIYFGPLPKYLPNNPMESIEP